MVGELRGDDGKPYSEERLIEAVEFVKAGILESLEQSFVLDLAFIGNASSVYPWEPAMIIDLDVCLFVTALDQAAGGWLLDFNRRMRSTLDERGMDFELRIIRGPYKPVRDRIDRPAMVLHGAVFTEAAYLEEAALMRWGWQKYICEVEARRLVRLAPAKPGIAMLLNGAKGVNERLAQIKDGRIVLQERQLPSLKFTELSFASDHPLFAEYCLTAGATTARNHARVIGREEANRLPNEQFFPWYQQEVFASESLAELIQMKSQARQTGYGGLMPRVGLLAEHYLTALRTSLEDSAEESQTGKNE